MKTSTPFRRGTLSGALFASLAWAMSYQPAFAIPPVIDPETDPVIEDPTPNPAPDPASPPSGGPNATPPLCQQPVMPARRILAAGEAESSPKKFYATPADYDGDGRMDMSVVGPDGTWGINYSDSGFEEDFDAIVYFRSARGQLFQSHNAFPVPADYDGDCKADRSFKDRFGDWYIDYAANGFGAWDLVLNGFGDDFYHAVPSDYDGDGKADLSTKDEAGNWFIDYAANGFGVGLPHLGDWDAMYTGFGGPDYRPVPADYDGDGKADFSTRDGDRWFIDRSSNGRGEEAWDEIYPGFADPLAFRPVPADYDGDGKADFSSRDGDNWYIDWSSNGRGEEAWDAIYPGFGGVEHAAAPMDYDGDSRADLASVTKSGVWMLDYAANGYGVWDDSWVWLPQQPDQPWIVSKTSSSITVAFNDDVLDSTQFVVGRKQDNIIWDGDWKYIRHESGTQNQVTFTDLNSDQKYCFKVYIDTPFGRSTDSRSVCGETGKAPPSTKADVTLFYRMYASGAPTCTGAPTFQLTPQSLTGSSGIDTVQTVRPSEGRNRDADGYCKWFIQVPGLRTGAWSIDVAWDIVGACRVDFAAGANSVKFTQGVYQCTTGTFNDFPVAPSPPPPVGGGAPGGPVGGPGGNGPGDGRPPVQEQ